MISTKHPIIYNIDEHRLSTLVFVFFSSWLLSFPFEGRILYELCKVHNVSPSNMIFGAVAIHFLGLLSIGFFIKTKSAVKVLMLSSIAICFISSIAFFFPPSSLWTVALIFCSFCSSGAIVAWSYYFRDSTHKSRRIKIIADVLIYSNILMILLNVSSVYISPYTGLVLAMIMLCLSFLFGLFLPNEDLPANPKTESNYNISIVRPLAFLYLFIVVITVNSGLMYQVVTPSFSHLGWLTSWYWAIPYILAIFIIRNLPNRINRSYILFIAISMIGLSFVTFMIADKSATSYIIINTLMMGAFGVNDLFWWSIIGDMIDFDRKPGKILGIGLSANVFGIFIGDLIGESIYSSGLPAHISSGLALGVVCVTLVIIPLLHRRLSSLLDDHAFLLFMPIKEHLIQKDAPPQFDKLSARESQIAALLLQGKTYKAIASELNISENTVKTHIKNIYSKYNIQSRGQLIDLITEKHS